MGVYKFIIFTEYRQGNNIENHVYRNRYKDGKIYMRVLSKIIQITLASVLIILLVYIKYDSFFVIGDIYVKNW